MDLEVVLNYVTLHNQAIIQWLIVAILTLVATLIALALFGRRERQTDVGLGLDAGELAETLKKVAAQAAALPAASAAAVPEQAAAPAAPSVDAPADAPAAGATERVRTLETELRQRDEEIARLKVAKPAAGDPGQAARLAELEAKLSEYEILEDDIADLSLYKEENTRLRAELEALKDGATPAPPTGEAAPAAADAAPADATAPARTAEAAAEAAASFAAFETAAAAEPVAAAPVVPAKPAAPEPIQRDLNAEADDLFAEFATALEESGVNLSTSAEPAKTSA